MIQSKYCWLGWAATVLLVAACTKPQPQITKSQTTFLPATRVSSPASLSRQTRKRTVAAPAPSSHSIRTQKKRKPTAAVVRSVGVARKSTEKQTPLIKNAEKETNLIEIAENRDAAKQLMVTPKTTVATQEASPVVSVEKPAQVTYDMPILLNKRVKRMLAFYLNKGKKSFKKGIQRSGKYLPLIRNILKQEGLPQDLAYLAAIESNYNPRARSSAGAVGMWQFMKGTARNYNLRQNRWIDERMDVIKSTHAAAQHLKYLFGKFGNWELALAAYNAGEGRVGKAIKRAKAKNRPTDYWSLNVPRETKRYVADYMAATIISKNLEKYGFADIVKEPPMDEEKVVISTDFSLQEIAQRTNISFKKLWNLNPFLIQAVPPMNQREYQIYLPHKQKLRFVISLYKKPHPAKQWKTKFAHANQSAQMTQLLTRYGSPTHIRVKKGDNLWKLAKQHKTTIARLRRWNKVNKKGFLKINQKLKLYLPTWKVFDALIRESSVSKKSRKQTLAISKNNHQKPHSIIVQPGDTLSAFSRKYRISVDQLLKWNKLKRATELKAYQQLIIAPPKV